MEFLREKAKNMHIIDDELYFVIDEKNNTIDLTEKGRDELAKGSKEWKVKSKKKINLWAFTFYLLTFNLMSLN